jgi:hypothetical protein
MLMQRAHILSVPMILSRRGTQHVTDCCANFVVECASREHERGSRGRLMTTPQIARDYGPRSLPMIAAQELVAAVYVLRGHVQP